MVKFLPERTKTCFDIPETFSEGNLGKCQSYELTAPREPFDVTIPLISSDAPAELRHREEVPELSEDRFSPVFIYPSYPEVKPQYRWGIDTVKVLIYCSLLMS